MSSDLAAIYRREVGRCTATLVRVLGDIDLAEDAVAEAFAVAAERWPVTGTPPNPGGWITTTARNRAIDRLRREAKRDDRHLAAQRLHADGDPDGTPELHDLDDFVEVVADDQLRLMFLCCHPVLSADAQVALTLRLLGGLEVPEIARAFLVPEATMAQRIVRAKRKLRDNHASYRIPRAAELPDRLPPVLAAISLVFTEGHTATSGDTLVRADLTAEAVRLARVLAELMPDEPEAVGLLRAVRNRPPTGELVCVSAHDPLNLAGTVLPGERLKELIEGNDAARHYARRHLFWATRVGGKVAPPEEVRIQEKKTILQSHLDGAQAVRPRPPGSWRQPFRPWLSALPMRPATCS